MLNYTVGDYSVEIAKQSSTTQTGYTWNVFSAGKLLAAGSARDANEGRAKATNAIEGMNAGASKGPVVTASSVGVPGKTMVSEGHIIPVGDEKQFPPIAAVAPAKVADPLADKLQTADGEDLTLNEAIEVGDPGEKVDQPKEEVSNRTKIKDDFPASEHLIAAGFTTYGKVRAATDVELLEIEHIGPSALKKIREAQ